MTHTKSWKVINFQIVLENPGLNSGGVDIEKGLISGITMCGKKSLTHFQLYILVSMFHCEKLFKLTLP